MLVFEQFDSQGMPAEEMPPEEQAPQDPLAEIEPLKKYYLSKKLIDLQSRLFNHGIQREDLDFLLKFQNELSYEVLMLLSNSILDSMGAEYSTQNKNEDLED